MKFTTELFYYGITQPTDAGWTLWLTELTKETRWPLLVSYSFPVKPTRKQVRKLRRSFRKMDGFCQ